MAKTIGRFAPAEVPNLPSSPGNPAAAMTGFNDRLNLIASSISPTELDSIRSEAETGGLGRLYELYEKMVATDSRIGGIAGSLRGAVCGLPVKKMIAETASAGERSLAEDYRNVVTEALLQMDEHELTGHFLDAYLHGAKAFQTTWRIEDYPRGRKLAIPQVTPIPGQALRMEMQQGHEKYGQLKVVTLDEPTGIFFSDIDPRKAFIVTDGYAHARYDTIGALRKVLGWWITKMYAQLWWIEYVESYGHPIRVGRIPPEATTNERGELKRFLRGIGRNKWGLFPQGADIQLLEAQQAGNITTFSDVAKFANNEIAVALIGQSGMTQDSAQGSRAKLQVLDGVRHEIITHIANGPVRMGYRKLADAILSVNYGADYNRRLRPNIHPVVKKPGSDTEKVAVFEKLSAAGIPVSVDEIHEQVGIPQAEEGALVLVRGKIQEMKSRKEMLAEEEENESTRLQSEQGSDPGGEEEGGSGQSGSPDRAPDQGSD